MNLDPKEIQKVIVVTKDGRQIEVDRGVLIYERNGEGTSYRTTWSISSAKDFHMLCELILGSAINFLKDHPEQIEPFFEALTRSGIVRNLIINYEDEDGHQKRLN